MKKGFINLTFILSIITFIILHIFLVKYHELYEYGVNTGTIAFFTIAKKYIMGDFYNAVVGGFGPLPSWLLIPFMKIGLKPKIALCIVNGIIGLLILIGIRKLSYRFEINETLRNIITFSAVPIVLSFTLTEHIPDLLVVCTGILYLNIIFDIDYPQSPFKGILCGIIGAIGYLGKAFMFPFFISHFLLFNILHYLRIEENKRNVLRNGVLGMLVFFSISGIWIGILSSKYNKITFDMSGTYNHRIIGPEVKQVTKYSGWEGWRNMARMGHPVYDQGFFPPPNDTAISIWEDFASLTKYLKPWSPFESWNNFKYQLKLIFKNIYYTIGIFETYFSIFSSIIILGYILLYIVPPYFKIFKNDKLYPLITLFLICGGYILVYPAARYLWINNILILLMGAHLLNVLLKSTFFNKVRKNLLLIAFVVSFVALPLKDSLTGAQNYDKNFKPLIKAFEKYNDVLRNKKIASNDKFSETLKLLFYLDINANYYGEAKENIKDDELEKELKKYDIDYYIVWQDSVKKAEPAFLHKYKEITAGEVSTFKIYSLKE